MSTARRILIVLLGAIGDVTRGLPLAVRVKRTWPDARITWAVEPMSRGLVESHPSIDRVVVFQRKRGLRGYREFIAELRQEHYDLVLDLQRHLKSGVTSLLSRGTKRLGFHRRNAKELNWVFNTEHIPEVENFSPKILQYQTFGDALGLSPMEPLDFGFAADEAQEARIRALLQGDGAEPATAPGGFAALLLGSSWPSRFWRAEYYRTVMNELYERHQMVSVLVGGPSEAEFAREILALGGAASAINLVEKTALAELFSLFRATRFAVGSDCGPMHIAAAAGIPVISLWGSTSPKRSAPYGSEDLVLQSTIGCSPCYRRRCPGLGTLCMRDIPPAAVIAQVERVLGRTEAARNKQHGETSGWGI